MYKIPANTLFMGKNLLTVPYCSSTNALAATLSKEAGFLEGTVVITDHQQRGRGQRNSEWIANPGQNLTFSILLKPIFLPIKEQFLLNAIISLGIQCCVQNILNKQVSIKWPNDILVERAKVCGILVENQIQGNCFTRSIVGIGLNVNQPVFPGFAACSLYTVSGREFSLSKTLALLLEHIEPHYIALQRGQYKSIKEKYASALFGLGEKHIFEVDSQRIEGVVHGVNTSGCLVVEIGRTTRVFNTGEIKLIA